VIQTKNLHDAALEFRKATSRKAPFSVPFLLTRKKEHLFVEDQRSRNTSGFVKGFKVCLQHTERTETNSEINSALPIPLKLYDEEGEHIMEQKSLAASALDKYQDMWDRMEDIQTEMEEIKQTTLAALDDLQAELTEIRLEAGGWLKVLESIS